MPRQMRVGTAYEMSSILPLDLNLRPNYSVIYRSVSLHLNYKHRPRPPLPSTVLLFILFQVIHGRSQQLQNKNLATSR